MLWKAYRMKEYKHQHWITSIGLLFHSVKAALLNYHMNWTASTTAHRHFQHLEKQLILNKTGTEGRKLCHNPAYSLYSSFWLCQLAANIQHSILLLVQLPRTDFAAVFSIKDGCCISYLPEPLTKVILWKCLVMCLNSTVSSSLLTPTLCPHREW